MRMLLELNLLPDPELAQYDLGVVNLACASGLPGSDGVDCVACLHTLDQWAGGGRRHTAAVAPLFRRDPASFGNSLAFFQAVDLATVLQRDIGVRYHPGLIARENFFADSRNLFLHGVISSKRGTCSSPAPLYVAIGRRLGYPLKLVSAKYHLFARWDDPSGERFNLECTSLGLNGYPDEHYLAWPEPTSLEETEAYGFLRSQLPRGEISTFLAIRGLCCLDNARYREAVQAYAAASGLERWNPLHSNAWRYAMCCCERQHRPGRVLLRPGMDLLRL